MAEVVEAVSIEIVTAALQDAVVNNRTLLEYASLHKISVENFSAYLGKLLKALGISGYSRVPVALFKSCFITIVI